MVIRTSPLRSVMKAVRVTEFGGPEVCKVVHIEKPTPASKQVCLLHSIKNVHSKPARFWNGTYFVCCTVSKMSTQNQPNFWWYLFRKNQKQLLPYDSISISNLGVVIVFFSAVQQFTLFWVLDNPNPKKCELLNSLGLGEALASANWSYQDKLTNCRPKLWDNK